MSFFDDNEDWIVYGRRGRRRDDCPEEPSQPKCKRCGSTDVRWRQQGGRWVLFSLQPGVVHQCPDRVASPDEFPDA